MIEELTLIDQLKNPVTTDLAFAELVKSYKERLYWHIRKMVISHEDADDVLQNTFIKVFKNIKHFKGESKLYSWMYRIATNEAITYLKKEARQRNVDIETLQLQMIQQLESDPYFDGNQLQIDLQKAIATLPQKQKLVFNMRYFDEMSYDDMADVLETSVGALKASYHHAKKKIEDYFRTS